MAIKVDSKRVQLFFTEPTLTKQSFKNEVDVNNIVRRFKRDLGPGVLDRFNGYVAGTFGDFSQVTDYRTALEQVARAEEVFMAIPAVIRKKFDNNTALFLDFCQNPANADELVKMGLAKSPASTPSSDEKKS